MDKNRIEELLDFEGLNAVILGDVMLDKYVKGNIDRISPEAPVPVLNLTHRDIKLGGAANVAKNVSRLGAITTLIGLIGNDENGTILQKLLREDIEINGHLIVDIHRKTTAKTRILSQNQHLLRIDDEDTHDTQTLIVDQVLVNLNLIHQKQKIDVLIMQDYNKGFFSPIMIESVIKWAKFHNISTCVDPKKNHISLFKGIHLFKPNLKEFSHIINKEIITDIKHLKKYANAVIAKLDCTLLLLTLGSQGIFVSDGNNHFLIPTKAKSIVDVSGAGDTVISLASLLIVKSIASLGEIGELSNYAGAAVCNIPGVGVVDKEMIIKYALGK